MNDDALPVLLARALDGERAATRQLNAIAQDHRQDREVGHVAVLLSRLSADTCAQLVAAGAAAPEDHPAEPPTTIGEAEVSPSMLGHRLDGAGIALLDDVQAMYLRSSRNWVVWTLLAQHAAARRLAATAELAELGQSRTAQQLAWSSTTIKTLAPQALSSAVARELPAPVPSRSSAAPRS